MLRLFRATSLTPNQSAVNLARRRAPGVSCHGVVQMAWEIGVTDECVSDNPAKPLFQIAAGQLQKHRSAVWTVKRVLKV